VAVWRVQKRVTTSDTQFKPARVSGAVCGESRAHRLLRNAWQPASMPNKILKICIHDVVLGTDEGDVTHWYHSINADQKMRSREETRGFPADILATFPSETETAMPQANPETHAPDSSSTSIGQ